MQCRALSSSRPEIHHGTGHSVFRTMRTMPSTCDVYVMDSGEEEGPKLDPRRVTLEGVYCPLDEKTPRVGRSRSPTMAVIRGAA